LSTNGDTNLVMFPPRKSLFELISSATPETLQEQVMERKVRAFAPGLPSQVLLKGGMMQIMPYRLTVR
jgi:hypothetical protein